MTPSIDVFSRKRYFYPQYKWFYEFSGQSSSVSWCRAHVAGHDLSKGKHFPCCPRGTASDSEKGPSVSCPDPSAAYRPSHVLLWIHTLIILRAKMAYSVRTSQRTLLPTERPDGECRGGKQKLTYIYIYIKTYIYIYIYINTLQKSRVQSFHPHGKYTRL